MTIVLCLFFCFFLSFFVRFGANSSKINFPSNRKGFQSVDYHHIIGFHEFLTTCIFTTF